MGWVLHSTAIRMVLATGWLIMKWLHKILSPKMADLSPKEKLCARLEIVMIYNSPVKTLDTHSHYKDDSDSEVSVMKQELISMQPVIERRTEEVMRLRKELNRREGGGRNQGHRLTRRGLIQQRNGDIGSRSKT